MTQFEKLDLLLRECGGTIQTFQVLNNGISKSVFYAYVKERGLEQASHGVYVSPDTWTDAMFLLHLRCGQAVFSHETASFFHDLTDREPLKYTITVRTGYNPSRLQEDGFQVYTVKKDLHEIGITTMLTSFGHSVPVYDMERTICDLLRSRKNIEMQVFQDALKQYAKRKDKNLRMTSLSHDVRTPLTTLIGYLDAAHKGLVTGKDRDDYIETARRKAHDLKEYIDVLFDWFKLNSNEFALEIQSVEAAELTRNILIDWIPIFEDKQVEYDIDIPEQPVRVRLDMDSYMRIVNNLIQNVIAHSHADKIKIALSKKENNMELLLADNGVGIEKEDLKHIFERLYKCDKGRSEKGSGLGLSIVHQLVEKMGGSITVESLPGKGTEFMLLFPLEI